MAKLDQETRRTEASSMGRGASFRVAELDAAQLRANVASRLFGGEAEPVKIGRYTVLRRLGAGGMGVVYSAYDEELDRKVAIKVLHGHAQGTMHPERLRREAQALARLSHPNVVQVYEVGEFRGQVFLAMEFIPGKTLKQLDINPRATLRSKLAPWIDAAKGLAAAHQAGLVHRDFKPDNAIVASDGAVKVVDFGLAYRAIDETIGDEQASELLSTTGALERRLVESVTTAKDASASGSLTKTGALVGTPAYMAPEQLAGSRGDARSDQFSFCVALWEYFCGQRPFPGKTLEELAESTAAGQRRSAPKGRLPSKLERILARGLANKPEDRFASMDALVQALSRCGQSIDRPWLLVAAGLPLFFATAFGMWSAQRPDPCDGIESHWQGVWSTAFSSAKAPRFDANVVPFADASWDGIVQSIERYVQQGSQAHREACVDAMAKGHQARGRYLEQNACFHAAARSVSEVSKLLSVATTEQIQKAPWLVQDLPSIEACSNRQATSLATASSPQDLERRDRLERQLAAVHVDLSMADESSARDKIEQLIAQAQNEADRDLLVRALILRARNAFGDKDLDARKDAIFRAYRIAESLDDVGLRFEAAIWRAELSSLDGNPAMALEQLRDIRALADREEVGKNRRIRYFERACTIERINGNLCEARQLGLEGLALASDSSDARGLVSDLSGRMAWIDYTLGDIDGAIERATRARELKAEWVGADSPLLASLDFVLVSLRAERARMMGTPAEALQDLLSLAQRVYDQHVARYGEGSRRVIVAQNNLVEVMRLQGQAEKALPIFASLLQQHPEFPGRTVTIVGYGRALIAAGRNDDGRKAMLEALAILPPVATETEVEGYEPLSERADALFQLALLERGDAAKEYAKQSRDEYHRLKREFDAQLKKGCGDPSRAKDRYERERLEVEQWLEANE